MTTTLVEKVRWPVDSAGSLMLQFETYGKVIKDIAAAVSSLFASGEQGVWYDPSDIAVTTINKESVIAAISQATVNTEPALTLFKNTLVDGRPLGDIDGNGSVNSADALAYSKYVQGTPNFAALLYIENVMHPYMVRNASTYAAYLTVAGGTLYKDAAGTTPVTAVEQPVGLMLDKSNGLVLGSELRGTGVLTTLGTVTTGSYSASSGVGIVNRGATVNDQSFVRITGLTANTTYRVYCETLTGAGLAIRPGNQSALPSGVLTTSGSSILVVISAATEISITTNGNNTSTSFTGLSLRELPGNHAYQTTSVNRPVLSARYNLLTKTEQFDDAAWVKTNSTVTANSVIAPDGTVTADTITDNATSGFHRVQHSSAFVSGVEYTLSVYAKQGTTGIALVLNDSVANFGRASFDLVNGTAALTNGISADITPVGDGWYRCSLTGAATTSANGLPAVHVKSIFTYVGTGEYAYIWGADLRVANYGINLPSYQRVNTATDYDTAGFPPYLSFNGSNKWLQTNSIDFTATDKMTVFAGIRKLSDAAVGIVAELSVASNVNSGAFYLGAPALVGANYTFNSNGTVPQVAIYTDVSISSPITNVLSGIGNISGDQAILRVNGAQVASNASDQGTGNFGNYPLYIGARAGTSLFFNGLLYNLIVRGAQSTDQQIIDAERYINEKTRAY